MRNAGSIEDLRRALTETLQELERQNRSPGLKMPNIAEEDDSSEQLSPISPKTKQQRVLDVRRLADLPIHHVPAAPWTDVTGDNDLVSHLISVWWAWHLPVYCYMDRDLFIKDMQSGKIEASFCSPFLVNAVLAMACVSIPESSCSHY